MVQIDRNRVRRAFSSSAENYDDLAVVQQRVVSRFLERTVSSASMPTMVLDVGAGTGRLLEALVCRYPSVFAVGMDLAHGMARTAARRLPSGSRGGLLCGDGEALPFRDGVFDLVISTSTYQWIDPLDRAFHEAWRVLKPGGRFCFALFGEATLGELKSSYRAALEMFGCSEEDRSHRFASRDETLAVLRRIGFDQCTVDSELEVEMHGDVRSLLRSLKGLGAANASLAPSRGLAGRRVTTAMMELYGRNYAGEGGVPATYEVLYGEGVRGVSG
jgi:malonyl-CoA O-methyltransferase